MEIAAEKKSDEGWAAIESDDMSESPSFVGGFDVTETALDPARLTLTTDDPDPTPLALRGADEPRC